VHTKVPRHPRFSVWRQL